VQELVLGGLLYGASDLLAFLQYGGPDASLKLARQLVTTLFNLESGSDPGIQATVDEAHGFLERVPPGSNPKGADKNEANGLKDLLDDYNNDTHSCDGDDDSRTDALK
jgi:hypothetical protein